MMAAPADTLDTTYAALADATRRAILRRLGRGSARVTDLAAPFDISLNAVSKHIRVLEGAGLVRRDVRGREHHLSLEPGPLRDAMDWIARNEAFWEARLDSLESLLGSSRRRRARGSDV